MIPIELRYCSDFGLDPIGGSSAFSFPRGDLKRFVTNKRTFQTTSNPLPVSGRGKIQGISP
jgi:hypothetical protein